MIGCGRRSGADQSMLIWELTLYKARFGTQNIILSLLLRKDSSITLSLSLSMATSKAYDKIVEEDEGAEE